MKLAFETTFNRLDLLHLQNVKMPVNEAASIRIKGKIAEAINSYIDINVKVNDFGEKEARGEIYVLHKNQVEHISALLAILGAEQVRQAVLDEILNK